jgi:hypothetical protein
MVPNILHFVFGMAPDFGGKPFSLVHYLSVRSAVELNAPEHAYFHFEYEPSGEWWEKAKPLLTLNRIVAPERIMGNELRHVAHKADVVRLKMLNETGGIYLDLDTISVKPFTGLLNTSFLIGQELRIPYSPKNVRQRIKYMIRHARENAGHARRAKDPGDVLPLRVAGLRPRRQERRWLPVLSRADEDGALGRRRPGAWSTRPAPGSAMHCRRRSCVRPGLFAGFSRRRHVPGTIADRRKLFCLREEAG